MAATNLGDLTEDQTVTFMWNTNAVAGESVTRTTDGTVSVYKNASDTPSTAGVTDTEDADGLTGVHRCVIDTSADAFYATGADYMVVLVGATIDGKAVNAAIAYFSIQNRYGSSAPTAAAIADAVWDEELSGHTASGSSGERLGRLPNVNAGAAGGLWILGANAAAATTLTGSSGNPALSLTGGSSSHGLLATGTGTGAGMRLVAGSAGNALAAVGGVSSITGAIYVTSAGGGGIEVTSTEGAALTLTTTVGGTPTVQVTSADGNALYLEGGGNSAALSVVGGSGGSLGHAVVLQRGHANADEISLANSDAPTLAAAFFTNNSGQTYASAVAGSVVKEIVDNTPGGTGATTGQIADAVWDELRAGHVAAGSFGEYVNATPVANSITAATIAADAGTELAAAVLAGGDIDGYSLEESQKLILAALAGKLSGAATTTVTIRAADDSKDRITATVDSSGNRSALTLDETG